jgi:hypothetical protein
LVALRHPYRTSRPAVLIERPFFLLPQSAPFIAHNPEKSHDQLDHRRERVRSA